jgi:hypothetical protein
MSPDSEAHRPVILNAIDPQHPKLLSCDLVLPGQPGDSGVAPRGSDFLFLIRRRLRRRAG